MKDTKTFWLCTLILTLVLPCSSLAQQKNNKKEEKQVPIKWRYEYSFEELKEIAKKDHQPGLELEPLKLLPKPGKYKVKHRFNSASSGIITDKKTTDWTAPVITKYIEGKFIVNYHPEPIMWDITTYSKKCKCYLSWYISGKLKEIEVLTLGQRVGESHSVSWTVYKPGEGHIGHTISNYQPKSNDKDWTQAITEFRHGEIIGWTKSVATRQKPFDQIKKETLDKIKKEFESRTHFTIEDIPDFTDMSEQEIEKRKDEIKMLIRMIDWSIRRKDYRRVDQLLKKVYPIRDQLDKWNEKLETIHDKVSKKLDNTAK